MSRPSPATFTILVIDDDPALLELASELLSGDGHRVLVAPSGEDALVMVRAIRPDLILLDYFMPKVDGVAVIERHTPGTIQLLNETGLGNSEAFIRKIDRRLSKMPARR